MYDFVTIDFETQSACDIKKAGAEKYAEHETTSVLCLGYKFPGQPSQLWKPGEGLPAALIEHVKAGRRVVAHNSLFELCIWNLVLRNGKYGKWPPLNIPQLDDTMPRARMMSLPGGLDDCCAALRLPIRKDQDGYRAMMKVARPRKREPLEFWTPETAPEDFARLYAYCPIDVEAGEQLHATLPHLIEKERQLLELDWTINLRGVPLDGPSVNRAIDLIAEQKSELSARVFSLTGGASTATQRDALLGWFHSQGLMLPSLAKPETVKAAKDESLSDIVKAVLAARGEAAKGSNSKLIAKREGACKDGRARGLFSYHGATTGRWAGRRIQPHNMPRPAKGFKPSDAEAVMTYLKYPSAAACIRHEYGSVMDAISWSLRSFIKAAPGHRFITADYSNIEGRVLAWLAGEEWKLEAFREFDAGRGEDLYKLAASRALGIPIPDIDDFYRQIGKVMELALGYSGGIGSFISMGANYGVVPDHISTTIKGITDPALWNDTLKRLPAPGTRFRAGLEPDVWCGLRIVVDSWRAAHPHVVHFWRALEDAAIEAVEYPGQVINVPGGLVKYRKAGDFLQCKLPSGRCITYPYAEMKRFPSMNWEAKRDELKYALEHAPPEDKAMLVTKIAEHEANIEWAAGLTYWGVSSKGGSSKKWKQQRAYGGLLAENVTQAVARDCLAEAIPRLEAAGYPVVMHVHDEIVSEVPNSKGDLKEFAHIMCAQNEWAAGLPVVAAGWEGERYRKA